MFRLLNERKDCPNPAEICMLILQEGGACIANHRLVSLARRFDTWKQPI
jgi:hypothetical protein